MEGDEDLLEALLPAPIVDELESVGSDHARDRLRRREAALRAVLEGLPDATVASRRDGRIVFVNERACELFGYAREELIGRPVDQLWPERLRERYRRNVESYFATAHPLRFSTRADGLRSDGSEFVGEMSWGIVETEAGPLLLAIGRDVTAHREALARLKRQSAKVEAIAALGERALAGADVADLAAEAVERLRETLPLTGACVVRDGETLATFGEPAEARFEIRTGEDVFGALGVVAATPLDADRENFLRGIANVLAIAMSRLRSDEQMRFEALHDPLTGLANRTLCRERLIHALARATRDNGSACVLFIDLDAFKSVNDLYGHAAGDALLIAVGRRLVATVRPADTVARFGGDEFVVVCEDVDVATAIALGHRVAEAIGEPLPAGGVEHRMSASIGIALGSSGGDPDALLADADAAAYRAKAEGKGRVEVFGQRLRRHARERLRTAAALEHALAEEQLWLAFQPIVRLSDGGVVAHEALLRWNAPSGVLAAPADFIPIAEESAVVEEIGAWTLREACRLSVARFGAGEDGPAVHVNLSRRQLAQPELETLVCESLRDSGLPASRLRLEVKESLFGAAPPFARHNLDMLRELVIDEFGTGFALPRDLRVRAVKIARRFIAGVATNPVDAAITTAVVTLARELGIGAVAIGVETTAQADRLREIGCPLAQGFLFGAPENARNSTH